MQNAGTYWTDVGFHRDGNDMSSDRSSVATAAEAKVGRVRTRKSKQSPGAGSSEVEVTETMSLVVASWFSPRFWQAPGGFSAACSRFAGRGSAPAPPASAQRWP
jgi:hypothetical protein